MREALKTLTGEGLIQHRRNFGYSVPRLTASELAEMYIVRQTLESAHSRQRFDRATDTERRSLLDINATA